MTPLNNVLCIFPKFFYPCVTNTIASVCIVCSPTCLFHLTIHMAWTSLSVSYRPTILTTTDDYVSPIKKQEKKGGAEYALYRFPLLPHMLSPPPPPLHRKLPHNPYLPHPVPSHHFPPWATSLLATASRLPAVFILLNLLMSPGHCPCPAQGP